jgi:hypothetical protein
VATQQKVSPEADPSRHSGRTDSGMHQRFSAVVAGAAEDGATLPVGEFVNFPLCDVVKREA